MRGKEVSTLGPAAFVWNGRAFNTSANLASCLFVFFMFLVVLMFLVTFWHDVVIFNYRNCITAGRLIIFDRNYLPLSHFVIQLTDRWHFIPPVSVIPRLPRPSLSVHMTVVNRAVCVSIYIYPLCHPTSDVTLTVAVCLWHHNCDVEIHIPWYYNCAVLWKYTFPERFHRHLRPRGVHSELLALKKKLFLVQNPIFVVALSFPVARRGWLILTGSIPADVSLAWDAANKYEMSTARFLPGACADCRWRLDDPAL